MNERRQNEAWQSSRPRLLRGRGGRAFPLVARRAVALTVACATLSAVTRVAYAEGTSLDPEAQQGGGVVVVEQQSVPPAYPYGSYGVQREVPYEEGMAVPPGARVESRSRRGLVIAGSIIFGVTYGLTALVGLIGIDGDPKFGALLVPVVGPMLLAASTNADAGWGLALFVTLTQATGVLLFILGLAVRRDVLVLTAGRGRDAPRIAIAPTPLPGGAGVTLTLF